MHLKHFDGVVGSASIKQGLTGTRVGRFGATSVGDVEKGFNLDHVTCHLVDPLQNLWEDID